MSTEIKKPKNTVSKLVRDRVKEAIDLVKLEEIYQADAVISAYLKHIDEFNVSIKEINDKLYAINSLRRAKEKLRARISYLQGEIRRRRKKILKKVIAEHTVQVYQDLKNELLHKDEPPQEL